MEWQHPNTMKRPLKDVLVRGDQFFMIPTPKRLKSTENPKTAKEPKPTPKASMDKTPKDSKPTKPKVPRKPRTPKDPNAPKVPRKPRTPKITLDSDPAITKDNAKIATLLSQGKTWRFAFHVSSNSREIANYFPDHNTDSIKKRYSVCRNVLGQTFSSEDVHPLLSLLSRG
jgi:outer membrane biosynthesis protein TonB